MTTDRLVLASGSPRRKMLLSQMGFTLETCVSDVDETPLPDEHALDLAPRLARLKGEDVARRFQEKGDADVVILSADTIVAMDGRLLGKPHSQEEAFRMLKMLSGRTHSVVSGVHVQGPLASETRAVETIVRFRHLTDEEIRWYISTGEPMDKAGSYAIQGIAGAFVESIQGSHSSVIGLPLAESLDMLARAGLRMPWGK